VKFTKMHGIGNDFVVVDAVSEPIPDVDLAELSKRINDRKFGVGSDGLIFVMPSRIADFRMRMFNPDGSEAEMCGNGTRCVARFVYDRKLKTDSVITLETLAGIRTLRLTTSGGKVEAIRVDMGRPRLRRSEIPMRGPDTEVVLDEPIKIGGRKITFTAVSMGNPHVVVFDQKLNLNQVAVLGPAIENHRLFPQRTNVQFCDVQSTSEVVLRTWERGAGVTLACGTGACAAVVAGVLTKRLTRRVKVHLLGGDLLIEWNGDDKVMMTGPAEEVFQGDYPL
jgi:diaminopimelate epimerase